MSKQRSPSRPLRPRVEELLAIIEAFCFELLDEEYAVLCAKLVGKLVRPRPSPLSRGDVRIWAAGVIYTIAANNFLFDPTQTPHITADDLCELLDVRQRTVSTKSREIRKLLNLSQIEPELCRQELLQEHPTAWLVKVDGIILDARSLPPELQAQAQQLGLIPTIA